MLMELACQGFLTLPAEMACTLIFYPAINCLVDSEGLSRLKFIVCSFIEQALQGRINGESVVAGTR